MKATWKRLAVVFGAFAVMLGSAHPATAQAVPESPDPIRLAMNEWASQQIVTQIAGKLLRRMGYQVEYVTAGYYPQMTAIQDGNITATLEIWEVNIGEGFPEMVAEGRVEVIGELGLDGAGGWVYPAFVETMCPGLPDWRALADCADLFTTPETYPKGRLVDFPADWGNMYTRERIDALGLDLEPVPAGSEGSMIAEMRSAETTQRPLLIYFWWPHWIFAEIDLKPVRLPDYGPGCYDDPAWGINPELAYDCGESKEAIVKVAWPGMKDTWPAAYRFLKRFTITNDDDIPMMYAVESEGKDLDAVTDAWINDNEGVWKQWIEAATE